MGWDEPRRYRSDDRDLDRCDNDLVLFMGDNGDWYATIVPHGKKLGLSVRITTSGAPRGQELVALAIANVYRALGGERMPPIIHRDDEDIDVYVGPNPQSPSPLFTIAQLPNQELEQLRARVAELETQLEDAHQTIRAAEVEADRARTNEEQWRRDAVEDKPAREVLAEARKMLGVGEGESLLTTLQAKLSIT